MENKEVPGDDLPETELGKAEEVKKADGEEEYIGGRYSDIETMIYSPPRLIQRSGRKNVKESARN